MNRRSSLATIPGQRCWSRGRRLPQLAGALVLMVLALAASVHASSVPVAHAIILDAAVRDSMDSIWTRSNQHWNELSDVNTLTQMIGSGKPTQREYLGCLYGWLDGDTLRITGTQPARNMKQLQFAVAGTCDIAPGLVGTWHTHPYRADPEGRALKEPALSPQDLDTFAHGHDAAVIVVWDADSLDAAARAGDGSVMHPVPVVVR
jgi:hypothetical protein